MGFEHGRLAKVYVNGYDLSQFLKSFSASGEAEVHEVTAFGATAKSYIAGNKETILSAEGFFDGDAGAVDQILQAALGQDNSIWTYFPQGDASVGKPGYGFDAVETSYEIETPVDDVAVISVEAQGNVGLERVICLHPLGAESASGQGTSVDNTVATSNGGVGYLQVTALSGTSLAVVIEHSADNGGGDPWSTICSFTTVTSAHKSERKVITGTVKRYIRAKWTLSGASATFSVAFNRK